MEFQGHHGMPAFLQAERCQLIRKNDMNVIVGVQFFKTRSHVTVTLGNRCSASRYSSLPDPLVSRRSFVLLTLLSGTQVASGFAEFRS